MGKKKQKLILPPELPPETPDNEVEVSDEDVEFVNQNVEYAGFVSKLDTQSITRHVSRVADANDTDLESLYEKRLRKKLENKEKDQLALEVDPVDALPVKTLDGKLYYRRVLNEPKEAKDESKEEEYASKDPAYLKLTKAEKREKQKKLRKEAKNQSKEEAHQVPQAEVLVEVEKELTAEEENERKKFRLAELGTELLADPESNIKHIKEMLEISKTSDSAISMLALKSLLAVFKDIIPGYRIRLPTEKELEMKVSKDVKRMRFFESTLLSAYKAYIQKLIMLQRKTLFKRVAVRCLCTLLAAVPHFNFRESLLSAVVKNMSSRDDVVRSLCCSTIKSLFIDEAKHGGEATVEAVTMIAELVKENNCLLHSDSVEVLLSLSFDDDLKKAEHSGMNDKTKTKKSKKENSLEESNRVNERKKVRKEMKSKTRQEVDAELKAASFAQDPQERRRMQTETLSAVFQIFFRILKHALMPKSQVGHLPGASGSHPLLSPCLIGIGKFSHLLDLDFMADLMQSLRKLAGNGMKSGESSDNYCELTVSERLHCCIVAFKVMRSNLDALNIDLQEFFVQFYNLLLEYRPGRDQGELLAEAFKIMLCDDRQHDMQRAAAFVKRLATFCLCFGSAESMAALVTAKHLLQKNVKCRNLLENDAGGGSVAGTIAKYQPHATDPNQSGVLASVLWELNLLTKHYHPSVSSVASSISTMGTSNQIHHAQVYPQQAYNELSHETMSFTQSLDIKKATNKRSRRTDSPPVKPGIDLTSTVQIDDSEVRRKLGEHFLLLHDIKENERLRSELQQLTSAVNLYEQYKKQKKGKRKTR
ncbi:nucleolar complex-associated protein 3 [Andrographis paniculata]|uniref:nucleolar complex-associated protein 3 n=1 Tax=Andrographis paniculata TaxID=175694 RepID=UPI0021E98FF5|nr:nucleolar complex-associated protein 3 [Andrographis paniculata]XP_051128835.1 nucleolar complex-associated protein 3 [Andrographis paniculata]